MQTRDRLPDFVLAESALAEAKQSLSITPGSPPAIAQEDVHRGSFHDATTA
jgi:hypothetical protein